MRALRAKVSRRRCSLLFVEDSEDDEALSLRAVSSSGVPCEVHVIRQGGAAIETLTSADGPIPDLIVLDFHLPGYNGLEILRELRRQERTRYVPVVMLSSFVSDGQFRDCLAEGASSCVKKPTDPKLYVEQVALIVKYWLTVDRRPEKSLQGQSPMNGHATNKDSLDEQNTTHDGD